MINSERNVIGVGTNGTCTPAHDNQLPNTLKKTALRDLQNENVGSSPKQQDNLLTVGKPNRDAVKVSGNKRLTPERPSSSQGLPSLSYNGMNENVMNARRRFELELGRGRLQKNVEIYSDGLQLRNIVQPSQEIPQKAPQTRDSSSLQQMAVATSNNMTPITAFSGSVPSVPNKQNNGTQTTKVSPDLPPTVDVKHTDDQLRTVRFICLQKFLKQCDETNRKEYMHRLMHLSPAELSKHAVELEKRAIQLTMEEGNEMQRMKALNILGKPSPTNNLLSST